MPDLSADLVCGSCNKVGHFTAPVAVVLVFAPGMKKPYPLIPYDDDDYRICRACDAAFTFVDKAVSAHPITRSAGLWTRAVVLLQDGQGLDVKRKRGSQPMALA